MAQTEITFGIDEEELAVFEEICSKYGLTVQQAVELFIRKTNECGGFPFDTDDLAGK